MGLTGDTHGYVLHPHRILPGGLVADEIRASKFVGCVMACLNLIADPKPTAIPVHRGQLHSISRNSCLLQGGRPKLLHSKHERNQVQITYKRHTFRSRS